MAEIVAYDTWSINGSRTQQFVRRWSADPHNEKYRVHMYPFRPGLWELLCQHLPPFDWCFDKADHEGKFHTLPPPEERPQKDGRVRRQPPYNSVKAR